MSSIISCLISAPSHKDRDAARRAPAMLALAAGIFIAAPLARAADAPVAAQAQPRAADAGTGTVRVQPEAKQFAPPNQPDVNPSGAREIDELYRELIDPQPATSSGSGSSAQPSGGTKR